MILSNQSVAVQLRQEKSSSRGQGSIQGWGSQLIMSDVKGMDSFHVYVTEDTPHPLQVHAKQCVGRATMAIAEESGSTIEINSEVKSEGQFFHDISMNELTRQQSQVDVRYKTRPIFSITKSDRTNMLFST